MYKHVTQRETCTHTYEQDRQQRLHVHVHESTRMEDRTNFLASSKWHRYSYATCSFLFSSIISASIFSPARNKQGVTRCTYIYTCTCTTLHGQHLHGLGICTIYVYTYNVYMVVGRSAPSSCMYRANRIDSHAHKT